MDSADVASFLIERTRISVTIRMVDIAACTMFVFDYFLTLGMEIDYVWPRKWTPIKIVFFIQRYLPFIDSIGLGLYQEFGTNLSPTTCHLLNNAGKSLIFIGLAFSEVILTFRVWAVWNRTKILTILLPILFAACWIPHIAVIHKFLKTLRFIQAPIPGFTGCFFVDAGSNIVVSWALLLVWDTLMLVMMAIPAVKAYHFRGYSALYSTLYGDGIIYYFYLFIMSLANIVLHRLESVDIVYRFLVVVMARCVHSMLTSRALLHIRARMSEGQQHQIPHIPASDDHVHPQPTTPPGHCQ